MPWELTIIAGSLANPQPLGPRDFVRAHLLERLPGAELLQPPRPPDDFLARLDAEAVRAFTRPRLEACYEGNDISIEFYCEDEDPVTDMRAEVRGNGDPMRPLAHLCEGTAWVVIEDATRRPVLRSQQGGWARFKQWRDRAIRRLSGGRDKP